MNRYELCWLAGLLEGEGSFGIHYGKYTSRRTGLTSSVPHARIQLNMNDRDVVQRAHVMMNLDGKSKIGGPYGVGKGGNNRINGYYASRVNGQRAIELMRLLYPYMGVRRQQRINEVLEEVGEAL